MQLIIYNILLIFFEMFRKQVTGLKGMYLQFLILGLRKQIVAVAAAAADWMP